MVGPLFSVMLHTVQLYSIDSYLVNPQCTNNIIGPISVGERGCGDRPWRRRFVSPRSFITTNSHYDYAPPRPMFVSASRASQSFESSAASCTSCSRGGDQHSVPKSQFNCVTASRRPPSVSRPSRPLGIRPPTAVSA